MTTAADIPATPPPTDPGPRRFERLSRDRVIGGVCGGLGRYFGIDPTLVRIAFVALAFLGGTGLIIYAAAILLVPNDGEAEPSPKSGRDRVIVAGAVIALTIVGCALGLVGGFGIADAFAPIAFLALAGLAVYWLASGRRPSGAPADVARRALLGIALLIGCAALALGSFLASGLGGGVVVAALVIAAGAGLVVAAFVGGARWLILPALAIALPLAFVSAADIDLRGGFGERTEHQLRASYKLGAGALVVDLRNVKLGAGDHRVKVGIGTGHALILVRDDVCVATKASVGMGAVAVFDRDSGGVDVTWDDSRRAPTGTPRLVVDGDVGLGFLEVRHNRRNDRGRILAEDLPNERNSACATTTASTGTAGASHG